MPARVVAHRPAAPIQHSALRFPCPLCPFARSVVLSKRKHPTRIQRIYDFGASKMFEDDRCYIYIRAIPVTEYKRSLVNSGEEWPSNSQNSFTRIITVPAVFGFISPARSPPPLILVSIAQLTPPASSRNTSYLQYCIPFKAHICAWLICRPTQTAAVRRSAFQVSTSRTTPSALQRGSEGNEVRLDTPRCPKNRLDSDDSAAVHPALPPGAPLMHAMHMPSLLACSSPKIQSYITCCLCCLVLLKLLNQ